MNQEVSIIIPVYNAEDSLDRCVESIVYGELRNLEVILIEDCSKDNSWEICCKLSKQYTNVRCYRNKRNSGVSYSRNHGLKKAIGKYIIFADSDDWVSGKYAKTLVDTAEKFQQELVICGLHFFDNVSGYRKDYLWNEYKSEVVVVEKENFFGLVDRFLIQQLWNKIFCSEIIEQYNIRFDESQSMGEDFQFVLDYMEAAKIQKCIVVNRPLYYYIRANNVSLMSKFGLVENENEYRRLEKLKNICGKENNIVEEQFLKAIKNLKYNYIYQACRNPGRNKSDKIAFIEQIMQDGKAKKYFKIQQRLILKEKIVGLLKVCVNFPKRVIEKIKCIKRDQIAKKASRLLKAENFSIISQNCIGGVFYHDMGIQFLSPTVNLFFKEPDFVRFVQNLEYYFGVELEMYWEEEYPIGKLDDLYIYFMHYQTCSEAKENWNKRKQRINWEKIIVLATDMEGFDDRVWEEWCKIVYPKVLFTAVKRNSADEVFFSKYKAFGHVLDLIPNREFYKDGRLMQIVNSYE